MARTVAAGANPLEAGAAPSTPPSTTPLPPFTGTKFSQLRERYEVLWKGCVVRPERAALVAKVRAAVLKGRPRYDAVASATGAPWWFIGIVHGLEGNFKFNTHLHNGDPLGVRTVQVPRGRPPVWNPPSDWASSAIDAVTYEGFAHLTDWSLARSLFRFEGFNGFGYYGRSVNSPYLWSFSNQYLKGKYSHDHGYDPDLVSEQCGAAVVLKAMVAAGDLADPGVAP